MDFNILLEARVQLAESWFYSHVPLHEIIIIILSTRMNNYDQLILKSELKCEGCTTFNGLITHIIMHYHYFDLYYLIQFRVIRESRMKVQSPLILFKLTAHFKVMASYTDFIMMP